GQPPVPLIAAKPTMIRVYVNVTQPMPVTVGVTIAGQAEVRSFSFLNPNCTTQSRRANTDRFGCRSYDFEFGPPEGNWTITVHADTGGAVVAGPISFGFRNTPKTQPIQVVPVTV